MLRVGRVVGIVMRRCWSGSGERVRRRNGGVRVEGGSSSCLVRGRRRSRYVFYGLVDVG